MDHSQAEKYLLETTRAYILASGDKENAIAFLVKEGFSNIAAALYADLVPMAFGWGLLKTMGVQKFPSEFDLTDTGEKVKVSDSHIFTTALGIALDIFRNGYTDIFSQRVVEMLISHSAEVVALNKALNSEPDLNLSEVSFSSSLLGYTSVEFEQNA
ncbi:hypothetical protein L1077_07430 [Pseudoalteromonas luteoviolacea]|uniref:hypothetical protein n=1 Tax=Pseudoalteromonas luteoviolacea TaxID=43657 RepID=UPI001F30C43F|nr:hypothetical protein [Pseudoalteromonas luteoviolacea]MCF6439256.1 hypothetical protein [Pseudoalteromonas luteoviolacea]